LPTQPKPCISRKQAIHSLWFLLLITCKCSGILLYMTTATKNNSKSISFSLTLDQLAVSLRQLSKSDFEVLEELIDRKFQKTIISRGKSGLKREQRVSLQELKKEFG
jgi:hypothetical protein